MNHNIYTVNHFTIKGNDTDYTTTVRKTQYKAYTRTEISDIFLEAGFSKIDWLMEKESGYYQPIFLAKR